MSEDAECNEALEACCPLASSVQFEDFAKPPRRLRAGPSLPWRAGQTSDEPGGNGSSRPFHVPPVVVREQRADIGAKLPVVQLGRQVSFEVAAAETPSADRMSAVLKWYRPSAANSAMTLLALSVFICAKYQYSIHSERDFVHCALSSARLSRTLHNAFRRKGRALNSSRDQPPGIGSAGNFGRRNPGPFRLRSDFRPSPVRAVSLCLRIDLFERPLVADGSLRLRRQAIFAELDAAHAAARPAKDNGGGVLKFSGVRRRTSMSRQCAYNEKIASAAQSKRPACRRRQRVAPMNFLTCSRTRQNAIEIMDDRFPTTATIGTIGEPRLRAEDLPLLRGEARFVEDIALPGELRAVFLRSPHAHARILAVRTGAAERSSAVRLVATGSDIQDLGGIPWEVRPPADAAEDELPPVGSPDVAAPQPLMAAPVARFAGEIVAMVVADGENEARDAAELIDADFEALDASANPREAGAQASLWPQAPGNLAFAIRMGDAEAVEEAFARAAHVVSVDCASNRVAGVPLETRGCIGEPSGDRMILHAPIGKPHGVRRTMAEHVFRVAPERIAVKVPDIGGGFGIKNVLYPEHCLTLWAARRLGRPVKWIGRRDECFLSDVGCREQSGRGELALDRDGNILAVRVRSQGNLGAYLAPRGVVSLRNSGYVASNVYAVPHIDFEMRAFHSNTAPTCNFRGAGEPEGVNVAERLAARAARSLKIDPVAFRRRNLLAASALPRTNPAGLVQDAGDYEAVLDRTMEAADRDGFAARRQLSETNGRLRGWGMAMHLYMSGFNFTETTTLAVRPDGRVDLFIGAQSSGQGHATVFAQIASARLGIDPGAIRVVQGDTDLIPAGSGTGASRSLTIGGSSAALAADALVETGRRLAAQALEAAPEDISYRFGRFGVAGTDRGLDLGRLAEHAERNDPDGRFSASASYRPRNGTSAAGCQICEAEVDPETGAVDIDRFAIVQDAGRAINPLIVEGQIHGGVATGLGQSLCEHAIYERGTAQLLTGSFMDYGFPRADQTPSIEVHLQEVPSVANPLGAKGIGEAGGVGAMPAIVEAILDALSPLGVEAIDTPATPQRVWQAIGRARPDREKARV